MLDLYFGTVEAFSSSWCRLSTSFDSEEIERLSGHLEIGPFLDPPVKALGSSP